MKFRRIALWALIDMLGTSLGVRAYGGQSGARQSGRHQTQG